MMINKTLKNLILATAFVFAIFGVNEALAYDYNAYDYGNYGSAYPAYQNQYSSYNYNPVYQPPAYYYGSQDMPITYVDAQPKVQYIKAPQPSTQIIYVEQPSTTTQIKYVPAQQNVQYVTQPVQQQTVQYVAQPTQSTQYVTTGNTQGASVINATSTKRVATRNTGVTGNTGQYISYDPNSQNVMGASAYGAYNVQPVVYDTNGVTALSVGGSGGFMPSSVFQWFMFIILILAIVIVARMVSKTFSRDTHTTIVH